MTWEDDHEWLSMKAFGMRQPSLSEDRPTTPPSAGGTERSRKSSAGIQTGYNATALPLLNKEQEVKLSLLCD